MLFAVTSNKWTGMAKTLHFKVDNYAYSNALPIFFLSPNNPGEASYQIKTNFYTCIPALSEGSYQRLEKQSSHCWGMGGAMGFAMTVLCFCLLMKRIIRNMISTQQEEIMKLLQGFLWISCIKPWVKFHVLSKILPSMTSAKCCFYAAFHEYKSIDSHPAESIRTATQNGWHRDLTVDGPSIPKLTSHFAAVSGTGSESSSILSMSDSLCRSAVLRIKWKLFLATDEVFEPRSRFGIFKMTFRSFTYCFALS